jgi:hypothetical protein
VGAIVTAIIGSITTTLWQQISPIFLNALLLQNIPINQSQAYLGIILFAGVLISGLLFVYYIIKFFKKKPIEMPPSGIQYEQIACPKCNYPNVVYPPMKKYKEVTYKECEDKEGETDHNLKKQIKCENCHKKFEFYWCTGHFHAVSIKKRKFDHEI